VYVSKNVRIATFDCFVPRFLQELFSGCSIRAIATLSAKHKGEMFDHIVYESKVPLF
jgi:hypothetical protein